MIRRLIVSEIASGWSLSVYDDEGRGAVNAKSGRCVMESFGFEDYDSFVERLMQETKGVKIHAPSLVQLILEAKEAYGSVDIVFGVKDDSSSISEVGGFGGSAIGGVGEGVSEATGSESAADAHGIFGEVC